MVEEHEGRVCIVDTYAFERFIIAAHANTEALTHAIEAYDAKSAESLYLLSAGQQAELQAEIYHDLASGWSSTVERLAWPAAGLGGLMLVLIAL